MTSLPIGQLMNREAIMQGLYNLLNDSQAFVTVSRKLVMWDQLSPQQKPAVFIVQGPQEYFRNMEGTPPRVVLNVNLFIYTSTNDPSVVPASLMNAALDAIDVALAPTPYPPCLQTLGGTCSHCWIEGSTILETGDLDGQGVAVIPLKILVGNTAR